MAQFSCVVRDAVGLHIRAAGELVKLARTFAHNDITISKGGKTANAKHLLSVVMLQAQQGDKVCFEVTGSQEEQAARQLQAFCDKAM